MSTAAWQKKRNIEGFTLTETLVVVAVLLIIAAFVAPNLIQNWKELQITELDGTARQIFLTAQNDLTDQKTSGRLVTLAAKSAVVQSKQVTDGAAATTLYYIESGTAQSDLTRTAVLMSTLPGSYVLYLNPASGDVTDVYYSKGTLSQNDVEALRTGGDDAELRAEKGIGYYGGLRAQSAQTNQSTTEHKQETLELVNGEDLYVKLVYPELGQAFSNPDQVLATVILTDQHTHTVTLTADGDSALGLTPPTCIYAGVDTDNDYTMYVLLDSMVSGCSFVTLFPDLTAGDDITVTISLAYNGMPLYQNAVIGTTNSLFAAKYDSAVTQNGVTHAKGVEFAYARQLSNLRYYDRGAGAAVQTADIDFTKDAAHRLKTMMPVAAHLSAAPDTFMPISLTSLSTQSGITIDGEDGRGTTHTLSNFRISGGDNVGLIGSCSVSATIRNLRLKDFTVSGRAPVGALIGMLQSSGGTVTVENCGVYLSASGAGSVAGGKSASSGAETPTGGLIGAVLAANGHSIIVENCFSALEVSNAQQQVGGLIGKVSGGTGAAPVKVLTSYASGSAASGTAGSDPSMAGGLIGAVGDTAIITSCFSSADVYGSASCGGLVGSNTGTLSVTGNYVCGTVTTGSTLTYGPLVYGSGMATYSGCRYLNQSGNTSSADAYSGAAPSGVTACEYDDLTKTAAGTSIYNKVAACHPYRSNLQGTAYPFEMVTSEYYGDWPDRYPPVQKITTPYGLCYFERYADSNGAESWGFYGFDKSGNLCDSLDYANAKTIASAGYGVLVPAGTTGVSAPTLGWQGKTATFGSTIEISAVGVDLYPIPNAETQLMTHDNQYNRTAIDQQAGRTLYINPHFAAALSLTELQRSSDDPMQIRTESQLRNRGLISDSGWYFKQTHNLSVTKADTGNYSNNTGCTYDGGENCIVGLQAPLLQENKGVVKNVRLIDVDIIQDTDAAALAVINGWSASITNCTVTGSVMAQKAGESASGLVFTNNGAITLSYSTASVTAKGANGLASGLIDNQTSGGSVSYCYYNGTVSATGTNSTAVGFCRNVGQGSVSNCFAVGTVTSAGRASGFTETADQWNGHVNNCYAAIKVSGNMVSGFTTDNLNANANATRYTNCYWAKQDGFNQTVSSANSAGKVTAITLDQLKTLKTLTSSTWTWDTASPCWTLGTTAAQTHPISSALNGKAYPYPRILGLDLYGDWPY